MWWYRVEVGDVCAMVSAVTRWLSSSVIQWRYISVAPTTITMKPMTYAALLAHVCLGFSGVLPTFSTVAGVAPY